MRAERGPVRAERGPVTGTQAGSIKIRGVKVADIDVSNVQTPTPNACAAFRRRTVSPFDPTDFDASWPCGQGCALPRWNGWSPLVSERRDAYDVAPTEKHPG